MSLATQTLRALDLIDEHNHPRREALLAQLAARWHTCWFPVARLPRPGDLDEEARLLITGQNDLRQPGWALLPSIGEEENGSRSDMPPRLLLADQRALAWLLRACGPATRTEAAAALISAAPSPVAVAQRQPPGDDTTWPTVHPTTAALEQTTPGLIADPTSELPLLAAGAEPRAPG